MAYWWSVLQVSCHSYIWKNAYLIFISCPYSQCTLSFTQFFFCHWKWIILKICSFLFTYLLTAVQDAPHPSLCSDQAQVSPTLRKLCTARETVISLRSAPTRKAALSLGMHVQCQKHYISVEAWILQKWKALVWMIVHGRIIQTEGLGAFFQCWSSSILALLACDSSQDNTLQPSSYEVICMYNSGWCLWALKPSENSKSVCLLYLYRCFSICRRNNIHPFQTGSERINLLNPIWHFEHAKDNKNAKHDHDFIPALFFFSPKNNVSASSC